MTAWSSTPRALGALRFSEWSRPRRHLQVLRPSGIKYDVRKFQWIGQFLSLNTVITVMNTSGARTIEDGSEPGARVTRATSKFEKKLTPACVASGSTC